MSRQAGFIEAAVVGAVMATAAALTVGCGANAGNVGDCDNANPPAECAIQCEPPPAANTCPAGFVCSPLGLCDDVASGTPDAGPLDPDANCPSVNFTASQVIPTVQLLVDQSGSMTAGFGGSNRWDAVKTALVDANDGIVKRLENQVVFGASLYTSHGGGNVPNECPILTSTATRAIGNFANIQTLFADHNPDGDTPTGESIDAAVADLVANPPAAGSPAIIVLATDGEPDSCADPNALARDLSVAAAAAAYMSDVRVFVLSVGSAVSEEHLQQVANAGVGLDPVSGDAPYYVANDAAQLEAAFDTIIGGVVSCDLALDGEINPAQAGSGTVTLDGVTLVYGTDWEVIDGGSIRLIGAACATLSSANMPTVTANFPCGAVID